MPALSTTRPRTFRPRWPTGSTAQEERGKDLALGAAARRRPGWPRWRHAPHCDWGHGGSGALARSSCAATPHLEGVDHQLAHGRGQRLAMVGDLEDVKRVATWPGREGRAVWARGVAGRRQGSRRGAIRCAAAIHPREQCQAGGPARACRVEGMPAHRVTEPCPLTDGVDFGRDDVQTDVLQDVDDVWGRSGE